jgi:hypothetical protein
LKHLQAILVNGDVVQLKRLGEWKSSAIRESYVPSSLDSQMKTADIQSVPKKEDESITPLLIGRF